MRCTTRLVAQRRAEAAYRLHYVYLFRWAGIAETLDYKSAASARRCACRFKETALRMFYDVPSIENGRERRVERVQRTAAEKWPAALNVSVPW